MIIKPIERLTKMIKQLASMVFVLSNEEEGETMEFGNEMEFIEQISAKMGEVFDSEGKNSAESGRTSTNRSVVHGLSTKAGQVAPDLAESGRGGEENDEDANLDLIASRVELNSLNSALENEKARSYFRLFLSREFNVENITFWESVLDFRNQFKAKAMFLYTTYISQAAMSQVNIPAKMRAAIKDALMEEDIEDINIDIFNDAQEEIYKVMQRDPFPRFLKSDLAITYAKIAHHNDEESKANGTFLEIDADIEPKIKPQSSYVSSFRRKSRTVRRASAAELLKRLDTKELSVGATVAEEEGEGEGEGGGEE